VIIIHRRPEESVSYEAWEMSVSEHIKSDPLWGLRVYRAAMYAAEVGRRDAAWLARKQGFEELAQQLRRSTASIPANMAEGYSRNGKHDRNRFYEYALGSARESRTWYYQARDVLGPNATHSRIALHTTIARILAVLVRRDRETAVPIIEPEP
jgi:four helix bundle protein